MRNEMKLVENNSQLDNVYFELPDDEYLVSTDFDGSEDDDE